MTRNTASNDANPDRANREQPQHGEAHESGHTGEGSASALAHLISQSQAKRRQNGETTEDPAGSGHP